MAAGKKGIFSVNSAYKLGLSLTEHARNVPATSTRSNGDREIWKKMWSLPAPPKVRTFAWRAITNSLATEENKKNHHILVTGVCTICGQEQEDVKHALYRCPPARALWNAMRDVWDLPSHAIMERLQTEWIPELLFPRTDQVCARILMVLWRVWHGHNELTHDKPFPSVEGSRRFLCSYMASLLHVKNQTTEQIIRGKGVLNGPAPAVVSHITHATTNSWERSPAGMLKLNIDGSYSESTGAAGAGMILRDEHGRIVFSSCRFLSRCGSALEAELSACMEGMSLAMEWSQ